MGQDEFDLLIVDDEPEIIHLLRETFSDLHLTVQTAGCVAEARAELAHHTFKVVLSDYNLPDGNGVDFLAELRGSGLKTVPVLITGLTDLNVAVDAINRGKVFKFLTKPLDLRALAQIVNRALEHYSAQKQQERLTHGAMEHAERLRQDTAAKEHSLLLAADRIRTEEETVEKQKAHIETLFAELQQAYLDTVTSLTVAIETKDRYTKGHSQRVYYFCSLMADVLGLPESSRRDLQLASVLHDVGKIGIPDAILLKPGPLSPEERKVIVSHPGLTDGILRPLPFLSGVRKIVREHHERFDGLGYPEGLKGDQISVEGRVLAVADAYDAMRSDRPYRKARGRAEALLELRVQSGGQFCPLCAGALVYGIESRGEPAPENVSLCSNSKWEEELMRLRPASDAVPVKSSVSN